MASKACLMRLQKEYQRLNKEPVPSVAAAPRDDNILEWHFAIHGAALEKSPYEHGQYHGKLIFPNDYPYKPPSIIMLTPNGRFHTNQRLCLSMSDFHPETWVPAWSVASILNGVLSFMLESTPTVGSMEASHAERRRLAAASAAWNAKTPLFRTLFPDLVAAPTVDAGDDAAAEGPASNSEPEQTIDRPGIPFAAIFVGAVVLLGAVGVLLAGDGQ